ncbi:LmeA family phospholipid-binding protein [Oscillatoriales cyanobacterium LEGE 11467]|uniref:LmeA family phospholipid-binding protein n=1 Tax=Zarconia navalis LEGE 11467 TaxID=1828826 RepID=A0A928VX46_9CYAN|nr:DUF2993 domain-containing protein [Zarconia navalis]MBE9039410.1 LmeA family phospholipid-binding protein [Zarconia navalis LEGE 11467]
MSTENLGIAQQAVNKAAEFIFATRIDSANHLAVEVNADPERISRGAVDSIWLSADEVALSPNFRVEKLEIEIANIAIDPMRALLGNVELTQPSQGKTCILLTDENFGYTLSSQKVRERLKAQDFGFSEALGTLNLERVECRIKSDRTIEVDAEVISNGTGRKQKFSFEYALSFHPASFKVMTIALEESKSNIKDGELFLQLREFMLDRISELLNLAHFRLDGVTVKVSHLEVREGTIELQAKLEIQQIPSTS